MKKYIYLIVIGFILFGCSTHKVLKVGEFTYEKISDAKNGQVELWKRNGDDNHYYTPTLKYSSHPESEPSFNTLIK